MIQIFIIPHLNIKSISYILYYKFIYFIHLFILLVLHYIFIYIFYSFILLVLHYICYLYIYIFYSFILLVLHYSFIYIILNIKIVLYI
jgi:hypothetical protein